MSVQTHIGAAPSDAAPGDEEERPETKKSARRRRRPPTTRRDRRRRDRFRRGTVLDGTLGSVLEWYGFAIYGYLAPIIGKIFFPSDDPVSSLLAAFGVFAIGFAARPVGGILFGQAAILSFVAVLGLPETAGRHAR